MLNYLLMIVLLMLIVVIFLQFRPAPTGRINTQLSVIRSVNANFYVLQTAEGIALFDCGSNASTALAGFQALQLAAEDVRYIFLTHSDYDHSGGRAAFPNAKVYLSRVEEQMINGQTKRRFFLSNHLSQPYHLLDDGEMIQISGTTVQMHLVPGHTPGSALYIIDDRYLCSGDLWLFSRDGISRPFFPLMNLNQQQITESGAMACRWLEGAELVLTGHSGVVHLQNPPVQ